MKKLFFKENQKQLIILISALAIINSVMNYLLFNSQNIISSFIDICIYFQIFSFIVGIFIALIPYNKEEPKERWLSASLGCMFVLQAFLIICYSLLFVFHLIGWRK